MVMLCWKEHNIVEVL